IEALRDGREEDLREDEQLLTKFIRQIVNGTVDDETWDRMEARLGLRGVVEYAYFIAFLIMTIRLHQAIGVPELSPEEVNGLIDAFKSGSRKAPDASVRFV